MRYSPSAFCLQLVLVLVFSIAKGMRNCWLAKHACTEAEGGVRPCLVLGASRSGSAYASWGLAYLNFGQYGTYLLSPSGLLGQTHGNSNRCMSDTDIVTWP